MRPPAQRAPVRAPVRGEGAAVTSTANQAGTFGGVIPGIYVYLFLQPISISQILLYNHYLTFHLDIIPLHYPFL